MLQLIDNVVNLAQSVAGQASLAPQAGAIPQHATAFAQQIAPEMQEDISAINNFIGAYRQTKAAVDAAVEGWKSGDDQARAGIETQLQGLLQQFQIATTANDKAFQDLSGFKELFFSDEQQLNNSLAEFDAQVSALRANYQQNRQKLSELQAQILIMNSNPLSWVIGELSSLITDSKSTEQSLIETSNQLNAISQQYYNFQHTVSTTQQMGSSLDTLINSAQNLSNAVSVAGGQMQQLADTSGNADAPSQTAVVFKAYWDTFSGQVNDLDSFVNN